MYGSKSYATTTYAGLNGISSIPVERTSPYCKMDTVYFEQTSPFTRKTNPYQAMESDC